MRSKPVAGCLRELGYKPFYLPSIFDEDLYFAGTVERRVSELHEMFARPRSARHSVRPWRLRLQLSAAAS